MLKKRVIPVLLMQQKRMVKGKRFSSYRETGLPSSTVRIYSAQDADELCFINLDSADGLHDLVETLGSASRECFMPLTAGGGIKSQEDAHALFKAGADKVLITSASHYSPELITDLSIHYGKQSIVCGIDYFIQDDAKIVVAVDKGKTLLDVDICDYALSLQEHGAGEIFLNCITNDGMMSGYDLSTASRIASILKIPVVPCGGAGNYQHLADLLLIDNINAAACASLFHFGDNNPIRARSFLRNAKVPMRRLK